MDNNEDKQTNTVKPKKERKSDNVKIKMDYSSSKKSKKIDLTKKKNKQKRTKKDNVDMIEHLRKKGIYVSGKDPKILKDIYMYSLDDNIKIINE